LTIPVLGADNVSDRTINVWGGNEGALTISVADGSQSSSLSWNSYDSYGNLPITSLEIAHSGGATDIICTFIA
jgi:hypothetical protein